ncbi:MAG: hypothetical protein LBF66_00990 [Holosporales bacterium]|nr:hypothetical protein [Holosporales bacterium]
MNVPQTWRFIVIHIPSDAPGFLRDQSLATSGLVPQRFSREPCILYSTRP